MYLLTESLYDGLNNNLSNALERSELGCKPFETQEQLEKTELQIRELIDFIRQNSDLLSKKGMHKTPYSLLNTLCSDNYLFDTNIDKIQSDLQKEREEKRNALLENHYLAIENEVYKNLNYNQVNQIKDLQEELDKIRIVSAEMVSEVLTKKFSERGESVRKYKERISYYLVIFSLLILLTTIYTLNYQPMLFVNGNSLSTIWLSIFSRLSILTVPYVILFFIMRQYNKEREIEESYRFKEAIAYSMPKYREIVKDHIVQDRLLEESARVIFEHPHERKQKVRTETKEPDLMESLNVVQKASDIIKSINKAD